MSELKPCTYDDMIDGDADINIEYYPKSDVDAAIAELKDKCQMHDFFWEGCGFAKRGFKNTIAVSEAFDRLEAENAELKAKLEDAKATAYTESMDAGMENRRLKHVLWLARAKRAEARKDYWYARSIHEGDERLWSIDGSEVKYIGCIKRTNFDWLKIWCEVEIKCRAMTEKFK